MTRRSQYVRQQAVSEGLMSVQIKIDKWLTEELNPFLATLRADLREITGTAEQVERHIHGSGSIPVRVRADE